MKHRYNTGDYIEDVSNILADMAQETEVIDTTLAMAMALTESYVIPSVGERVSMERPQDHFELGWMCGPYTWVVVRGKEVIGFLRIDNDWHTRTYQARAKVYNIHHVTRTVLTHEELAQEVTELLERLCLTPFT